MFTKVQGSPLVVAQDSETMQDGPNWRELLGRKEFPVKPQQVSNTQFSVRVTTDVLRWTGWYKICVLCAFIYLGLNMWKPSTSTHRQSHFHLALLLTQLSKWIYNFGLYIFQNQTIEEGGALAFKSNTHRTPNNHLCCFLTLSILLLWS